MNGQAARSVGDGEVGRESFGVGALALPLAPVLELEPPLQRTGDAKAKLPDAPRSRQHVRPKVVGVTLAGRAVEPVDVPAVACRRGLGKADDDLVTSVDPD